MRISLTDLRLGYKDKDTIITVRAGDRIFITLPEKGTTGYQWKLDSFTEHNLSVENSNNSSTPAGDLGAEGGAVTFWLQAKSSGHGEVIFKLTRGTQKEDLALNLQFNFDICAIDANVPSTSTGMG